MLALMLLFAAFNWFMWITMNWWIAASCIAVFLFNDIIFNILISFSSFSFSNCIIAVFISLFELISLINTLWIIILYLILYVANFLYIVNYFISFNFVISFFVSILIFMFLFFNLIMFCNWNFDIFISIYFYIYYLMKLYIKGHFLPSNKLNFVSNKQYKFINLI